MNSLDRENCFMYMFEVVVKDYGVLFKIMWVNVIVQVLDMNDNVLVFIFFLVYNNMVIIFY